MEIKTILIIAGVAILLIFLMSGRSVRYYCKKCGYSWKWKKHHKSTAPRCPSCGSHDIGR